MNTEPRVRGVHSSRPGGYTHNDAEDGLERLRTKDRNMTLTYERRVTIRKALKPCDHF